MLCNRISECLSLTVNKYWVVSSWCSTSSSTYVVGAPLFQLLDNDFLLVDVHLALWELTLVVGIPLMIVLGGTTKLLLPLVGSTFLSSFSNFPLVPLSLMEYFCWSFIGKYSSLCCRAWFVGLLVMLFVSSSSLFKRDVADEVCGEHIISTLSQDCFVTLQLKSELGTPETINGWGN